MRRQREVLIVVVDSGAVLEHIIKHMENIGVSIATEVV